MTQKRAIALLTGSHLCHNPRAVKEATALAGAGMDVEVLGAWLDPLLKEQDRAMIPNLPFRFSPVIDLTDSRVWVRASNLARRARTRAAQDAFRLTHIENRWLLGQTLAPLARAAGRSPAAMFIAHSEVGLAVARDLRRRGRAVGVDMEDWFSNDLLPSARAVRPLRLLTHLEQMLLQSAVHTSCPSRAMSDALARDYACLPPTVVYNAFPWADRQSIDGLSKDRATRLAPSIHWYSQTLGPGRGLEDLVAALPDVAHDVEIHLRGKPTAGFDDWIRSTVPAAWKSRVVLHGLVPDGELLSRLTEHDIGFAGELRYCRSRDLTVTNKMLHYLLAGLAVVASDTAGQREVAAQAPEAVRLYRTRSSPWAWPSCSCWC